MGLKGAASYTKADDASTTASGTSEVRSESTECSWPGLSGCWHSHLALLAGFLAVYRRRLVPGPNGVTEKPFCGGRVER